MHSLTGGGEEDPSSTRTAAAIESLIASRLAAYTGSPESEFEADIPFSDFGISSRDAVTLIGELSERLDAELNPALLWEHPTIGSLSARIAGELSAPQARPTVPADTVPANTMFADPVFADPVPATMGDAPLAIVGMGCRFPGADDPDGLWELVLRGGDAVTAGDDLAAARGLPGAHGLLRDVDLFDAEFFSVAAREAGHVDPQQRLLLEVAWEALESAAIVPSRLAGTRTGVFIGISGSDYGRVADRGPGRLDLYGVTGQAASIAANRLSYFFDLRGPSLAVDTACSSSLVALHLACASLRAGECATALAGGVSLLLAGEVTEAFRDAGMMASDGRCKTFDVGADGYVRAEGCGVVVLKLLADAVRDGDAVLAVVRGSAVNQDGRSNGLTAPNGAAQQEVVRAALRAAGAAPGDVTYVEAHGTGTPLGDPIEVRALTSVLGGSARGGAPLLIGSVKTNIGHAEAAAGVAGVIKVVQMMRHRVIPPHGHFREANPHLPADAGFAIPVSARTWDPGGGPLVAGVSSFGFGGTNAHVVLQEPAGAARPLRDDHDDRGAGVLLLSGREEDAVRDLAARYADLLRADDAPAFADVCHTANTRRTHFKHRAGIVASDAPQAVVRLGAFAAHGTAAGAHSGVLRPEGPPGGLAFLFSGQGSQYPQMARRLYETSPVFARELNRCGELLTGHVDRPLAQILFPESGADAELIDRTEYTQPALFAVEYALFQLWASWGIRPDFLLGHSVGELAAACVAGVFDLADGLRLVADRGRLVRDLAEPGAMLAVFAAEPDVQELLATLTGATRCAIAAVNNAGAAVVAGPPDDIAQLGARVSAAGMGSRLLKSGYGFHSPMLARAAGELAKVAAGIRYRAPRIPLVSDLDGRLFDSERMPDAGYWTAHLTAPIRFADGIATLAEAGCRTFIEVGPRRVLLGAASRDVDGGEWLPSLRPDAPDWGVLAESAARLHVRGRPVDWQAFDDGQDVRAVPVPTYPFQRRRYWLGAATVTHEKRNAETMPDTTSSLPSQDAVLAAISDIITGVLGSDRGIDADATFLELGADSLALIQALQALQRAFSIKIPISLLFEEVNTPRLLAGYVRGHCAPERLAAAVAPGEAPGPHLLPHVPQPELAAGRDAASGSPVGLFLEVHAQVMRNAYTLLTGAAPAAQSLPPTPLVAETPLVREVMPVREAAPVPVMPGAPIPVAAADTYVPFKHNGTGDASRLTEAQRQFLAALVERYGRRTKGSKEYAILERPYHADVRHAPQPFPSLKEIRYPLVVSRSRGARVWDVDGNEYVDLTMGFGANLFGHGEPFIEKAMAAQLADGMHVGPHNPLTAEYAALVRELTGVERVIFANTGSEAVMVAIRLARAVTERTKIALFAGSYHGSADPILARQDPARSGESVPLCPGVPDAVGHDTIVLPYGDAASLEALRDRLPDLAAVLVEPVQSRHPDLQPAQFLRELRRMTREAGTALILDEVITGFRMHPGGAQALFDVRADIVTYGKVIGGGLPVGLVAGDARFLDPVDGGAYLFGGRPYPQSVRTFFSGTFCKHPLMLAAGTAVLRELKRRGPGLQEELNERAAALAKRLDRLFTAAGAPVRVARFGSLFRLKFPLESEHSEKIEAFYALLMEKGVFVWEGRNLFLSTAHTADDIEFVYDAFAAVLDEMIDAGFFPGAQRARINP